MKVLRSDSDLNAFCGDYFPDVYARFTGGMDRVAKVNELLDRADLARIVEKLQEAYPDAERGQQGAAPPEPIYRDEALRKVLAQAAEKSPATKAPDAAAAVATHAAVHDPPAEQGVHQPPVGAPWQERVTGMRFVWVPPGRFLMGSSKVPVGK